TMIVRKLDVGALQARIEDRVVDYWTRQSEGVSWYLDITSTRLDLSSYPTSGCNLSGPHLSALAPGGGWILMNAGQVVCRYRFPENETWLDLTCHGRMSSGCALPNGFRFNRS